MITDANGTLAYAGLSAEGLFSRAKAAFAQAQPPVDGRFGVFLPLFPAELIVNMAYNGPAKLRGERVAPNGFSVDPAEYFARLYERMPELFAGGNAQRNFNYEGEYLGRAEFTVDEIWADAFPQYRPFMGDKLALHLIGGGSQAVAVPESVYPRGGGMLLAVEKRLRVTERAKDFVCYARTRVHAGEAYDADVFAAEYLAAAGFEPFAFSQAELERVLQDLSVIKSLQGDTAGMTQYTENARRAGRVNQYVPMRYACDHFAEAEADKRIAWLMQPCWQDADYIGDLWIPYPDFFTCVDKRTMTLDMGRLCQWYQIAPCYNAETGGGLYPDAVRIVSVRESPGMLLMGDAFNNPAYGEGTGPEGGAATPVAVPDSREMIRLRKLVMERASIGVTNRAVEPAAYHRMLTLAVLQEHKGRLIDAMYRCETALRQIAPGAKVYEKARALLTGRVDKLDSVVARETKEAGEVRSSGYDADLAYLREMRLARESGDEEKSFARDARREESIEGGYAMRAGLLRVAYANAALPEPPAEQTVGADDSEDGEEEPLPPLAAADVPGKAPAETETNNQAPDKGLPRTEAVPEKPVESAGPASEVPSSPEKPAAETEATEESPPEMESSAGEDRPVEEEAPAEAETKATPSETEMAAEPYNEETPPEESPSSAREPEAGAEKRPTEDDENGRAEGSPPSAMREMAQKIHREPDAGSGGMSEFLKKHGG